MAKELIRDVQGARSTLIMPRVHGIFPDGVDPFSQSAGKRLEYIGPGGRAQTVTRAGLRANQLATETQFLRCAPPFSGEPEPPLRRRSGSPAVHAPGRRLVIKRDFSVSRQCWWAAAGQRSQRRGLALKSRLARSRTGNTKSAQPVAMPLRGMEAYSAAMALSARSNWICRGSD
jgi:hypothetical protein